MMPQYSALFMDFLITDINKNIDFCDDILLALKQRPLKTSCFCGNVYELQLTADKVFLENIHDDEIASESMTLELLQLMIEDWRKKILKEDKNINA
ncbi:MAG: hypothetical protein Q9M50_10270 [Methylococcales bacterium]|nr:hypothetical protein [Methylococcales bacterium]